MHTFPVMFVFLAWQSDSSFRTSYFSSSTHGRSMGSLPKQNFGYIFFPPPRNAIHTEQKDHWNWQYFPNCRDTRRNVNMKLSAPNVGRLDKICVYVGCVCEVLMTVLSGPSQHQIYVFISLWNTISLWMLTVWCLLNHSCYPPPPPPWVCILYIHYVYVHILCLL